MSNALTTAARPLVMDPSAKAVLMALCDMAREPDDPDRPAQAWPPMRGRDGAIGLCDWTCLTDRAVQQAMKRLVTDGHVTRTERPGKGVVYAVHPRTTFAPTPEAGSPPNDVRPEGDAGTPERRSDKAPLSTSRKKKASPSPSIRTAAVDPYPMPDGVDPQHWRDFLANRARKRLTNTASAHSRLMSDLAVADFWRLQDFARRKARAFAGVTQVALLQHPELNARSANPLVGEARDRMGAMKEATRLGYLRAHANQFALVMFSRSSCGYCRVQWPIIERFREETGWQVTLMDLDRRPDLGARFGVSVTPTTMVIRRGSAQRMVIATGVEAYPGLAQTAYQAVKLLTGDIRPEQFLTGAGEEGGFFDALANGPVSAGEAIGDRGTPATDEREP